MDLEHHKTILILRQVLFLMYLKTNLKKKVSKEIKSSINKIF